MAEGSPPHVKISIAKRYTRSGIQTFEGSHSFPHCPSPSDPQRPPLLIIVPDSIRLLDSLPGVNNPRKRSALEGLPPTIQFLQFWIPIPTSLAPLPKTHHPPKPTSTAANMPAGFALAGGGAEAAAGAAAAGPSHAGRQRVMGK